MATTQTMSKKNREWWMARLAKLYEEAKKRNGGRSLTIYQDVSQVLDYLEEIDPLPAGYDLAQECDNLAGRLHRS